MYKNEKYSCDKECLGDDLVVDLHNLYMDYSTGDFNILADFTEIQELMLYFVQYCDYDTAFYDLLKWCKGNDCSITYMG